MTEDHITPEHLDATLETFRGRVYRASMERAIAEVRGWRCRLEETGDLDLRPIAENLGELETLLAADHPRRRRRRATPERARRADREGRWERRPGGRGREATEARRATRRRRAYAAGSERYAGGALRLRR